jgi:hypothetical protein
MPDDYGYDLSGTAFSTDPGVHNDRPAGRYVVTLAEQMQATYERAIARLRAEETAIEAQYGPNILDEWDEMCREFNSRKSRTER